MALGFDLGADDDRGLFDLFVVGVAKPTHPLGTLDFPDRRFLVLVDGGFVQ